MTSNEQPAWVCSKCGQKYGRGWPTGHLATWHAGTCGVCRLEGVPVTEPRDFRYLDMERVKADYPDYPEGDGGDDGDECLPSYDPDAGQPGHPAIEPFPPTPPTTER